MSTKDKKGNSEVEEADPSKCLLPDEPLIVLVNGDSASASEILAGDILDTKRGLIVGTQTYGKGSVQDVWEYPNPSDPNGKLGIRLTIKLYYTSSGNSIHGKGITPDVIKSDTVNSRADLFMLEHVWENYPPLPLLKRFNDDINEALDWLVQQLESDHIPVNRQALGRMLWERSIPGETGPVAVPEYDPVLAEAVDLFASGRFQDLTPTRPSYVYR